MSHLDKDWAFIYVFIYLVLITYSFFEILNLHLQLQHPGAEIEHPDGCDGEGCLPMFSGSERSKNTVYCSGMIY